MPNDTKQSELAYFVPTKRQENCRTHLYKTLEDMRTLKNQPLPHFTGTNGTRSFNTYIDDSEKILNGYTLSREDQGKEEWQSNLLDNISRAKLRAIAAGVGLRVPEMTFDATNTKGVRSSQRAEISKNIVKQSYTNENPTLNNFLQVWRMLSHGVIFEYEGYKTGGAMQEVVESFNSLTGEVKTKKEYRKMNGKPFSVLINPQEFYWYTFYTRDIQEQPRVCWVQHYTKRELELEFSKYKNYKYIKNKKEVQDLSLLQESTYYKAWNENVDEYGYEVIRMYSKEDDGSDDYYGYEVWINGVPLIQSPLLWGGKEKVYPFTKEISEPFANSTFFVGMSLAGILEAYQDGKNTVLNTLIDKLYRGVNPMKLVGLQNRDLLDVEASIYSQDDTIYVPDINAVKFLEHPQINSGELAMLSILDRGIEASSVSMEQQGVSSKQDKTARQAVIEDVRAQEIKSILYIFLENLWLQKVRLRNQIILTHYIKDTAAQEIVRDQIITVKDYSFGDGARGVLDIHIAKSKGKLLSLQEVEAREQAMEQQGIAYKLISITTDYLDNDEWKYDYKIVPQSFHKQDQLTKEDEFMGEIQFITTLFPEFFISNKDKYLRRYLELKGKTIEEYNPPVQLPALPAGGEQPTEGQPQEQPTPAEQPATPQGSVLGLV